RVQGPAEVIAALHVAFGQQDRVGQAVGHVAERRGGRQPARTTGLGRARGRRAGRAEDGAAVAAAVAQDGPGGPVGGGAPAPGREGGCGLGPWRGVRLLPHVSGWLTEIGWANQERIYLVADAPPENPEVIRRASMDNPSDRWFGHVGLAVGGSAGAVGKRHGF